MTIRINRKSNTMTISSLNEGRTLNKFNMDPDYQRKSVWSDEQQGLLIDSILKNIPIPPIFLRENIDKLGKTSYEVIDGKQRLTSIFRYIDNEIATIDDDNDPLHNDELAGVKLSDLEADDKLDTVLEEFWRYPIPIEYVYTKENKIVDKIFDRLNRSGEKLNGQELRHSNFYDSKLIEVAYSFANVDFWAEELSITNKNRMEDIELISEFVFLVIEKEELGASPEGLDKLYGKYARSGDINWDELYGTLEATGSIFESFNIKFHDYNVSGVSHLYGVWALAFYCLQNGVSDNLEEKLKEFYSNYKISNFDHHPALLTYKKSMENGTKNKGQRRKRREALVSFCLG